MLRSTQRRSLKLSLGNQCPQRRSSSGRATVRSSTDTFFRTDATDRRARCKHRSLFPLAFSRHGSFARTCTPCLQSPNPLARVHLSIARPFRAAAAPAAAVCETPGYRGISSAPARKALETGLAGWAYRTRTAESGRGLPDWIYVTIWPVVGASPASEALRVRAA
jgi:hypothetical protein